MTSDGTGFPGTGPQGWYPDRESGLVFESDLAPAAWLEPSLAAGSFQVRMTAPQGFAGYARIFFPFAGDDGGDISWTDMARRNGRIAHALMEAETIRPGGDQAQCYPGLTPEQFAALLPILIRHTSSPQGWFLLWDGFGDLDEQAFRPLPRVSHPMRNYCLLSGPHSAYQDFSNSPSYWWPADRAWCLCTDTDFAWAYLAGPAACIDEVLSVPVLDAYRTRPGNAAIAGMDVINDPGQVIPRQP